MTTSTPKASSTGSRKTYSTRDDLRYLNLYWQYLKPFKFKLVLGFIVIPIITAAHLYQPILIKYGIDIDIIQNKDASGLYFTGLIFGVCVLVELIARSLQSFLFQKTGIQSVSNLRKDLFSHLISRSSTYFEKTPVGRISTRVSSDVEALNETFSSGLITLIADLLNLLGIVLMMYFLSPKLTLITLAFLPILIVIVLVFKKKLREYYSKIRTSVSKLNSNLEEQLSGYTIVQLFGREKKNFKAFNKENLAYKKANMGSISFDSLLYSVMDAAGSIVIALLLYVSLPSFLKSEISLGLLAAFIDYVRKFFQPLKDLSSKFAILQAALAALEKIFDAFSVEQEMIKKEDEVSKKDLIFKSSPGIYLKNLSFSYPGFEDKEVLKNISFSLNPGTSLAIVGPTGSGKSSVAKLLSGFYQNYQGDIVLGDMELRSVFKESLRSQISVVRQDIEIFSETVEFNISLGSEDITLDRCIEVAKIAQIHSYIESLPDGYQTKLNSSLSHLSSGQAQLISIARALVRDSPIIILDEATASIDSSSEQLVQAATEKLLKSKTVLVIAHRLSTIKNSDKIIALKDGRIIESGTHQELINQQGYYAKLFRMQFAEKN